MAQVYYSPLSINAAQVPSTQTDFPVPVVQTDNRFKTTGNGGHVANSNGYDIRPYSDSALSSALSYELERYNASSGEVVMWVKVSSLTSSSTPIYLGYGDAALNTDGSSGANTFSNNFVEVYHLKDGSTLSGIDSVHNANPYNLSLSATATAGIFDGGAATSDTKVGTDGAFAWPAGAISLSAWANGSSFSHGYNTVASRMFGTYTDFIILAVKNTGKLRYVLTATTTRDADGTGTATLSTGTWYHLGVTYDSSSGLIGYVNGSSDATVSANGAYRNGNSQTGAIGTDSAGSLNFNGSVDEVRWSSVARAGSWMATEYNSGFPGTFETLGTEASVGGSAKNRRTLGPRVGSRQYYAH